MTDAPSQKAKRKWQTNTFKPWHEALVAAGSIEVAAGIIRAAPLGHIENDDERDPLNHKTAAELLNIFFDEDQDAKLWSAAMKLLCDSFAFAMHHLGEASMDAERWLKLLSDERFCRRLAEKTYEYEYQKHKLTGVIFCRMMKHHVVLEKYAAAIAKGIVTLFPRHAQEAERYSVIEDIVRDLPASAQRRILAELKAIALSKPERQFDDQAQSLVEVLNLSFEHDERARAASLYFAIRLHIKAANLKKRKEDARHKQFELGEKLKELNKLRDSLKTNPLTADSLPKVEKEIAQIQAQMSV